MMDSSINLQEYLELCREKKNFSIFALFLLSIFLLLGLSLKIEMVYQTEGYVLDDRIIININIDDLEKISQGKYVSIENKKYKYEIYEYEEEITSLGENYYKKIKIMINLEESLNQDYHILKLRFTLQKKEFVKLIIDKLIKKEEL